MTVTTLGRKACRSKKATLMGVAVATATLMAIGAGAPGVIPPAHSLDLNAVTTGPLFGIASALGLSNVTIADVAVLGSVSIDLSHTNSHPVNLNDQINSYPFGSFTLYTARRQPGGLFGTAILAASGPSGYGATQAYEALLSSAAGNTRSGYSPLVPAGRVTLGGQSCSTGFGCSQGTNQTDLALLLVNSPTTPNGGLYARFAPLFNLFGVNPVTPAGQTVNSVTGIRLNSAVIGLAQEYSVLSDFPVTLNPFSLTNSLLASFLPTSLLRGGTLEGTSKDDLLTKLGTLAAAGTPSTTWGTYVPNDVPLLAPLRLPVQLVNLVSSALGHPLNLGTPLADALQPAAEILVNTGYTNVQTPLAGGTYNRVFTSADSGTYTPFLSANPLTLAERLAVPINVLTALVYGFQNKFPLLRFGQGVPTLAATPGSNFLSITYAQAQPGAAAGPTAAVASIPATGSFRSAAEPVTAIRTATQPTPHVASIPANRPVRTAAEPNTAVPTATLQNTPTGRARAGTPAEKHVPTATATKSASSTLEDVVNGLQRREEASGRGNKPTSGPANPMSKTGGSTTTGVSAAAAPPA